MKSPLLERALACYRQYFVQLKEKEESELPRNGKYAVTADDSTRELVFEGKLQAIAAILDSPIESPAQFASKAAEIPAAPVMSHLPLTVELQDDFDIEPYLNPLTGQWIRPVTPFTPGPSEIGSSSQESIAAGIMRAKKIINEQPIPIAASPTSSRSRYSYNNGKSKGNSGHVVTRRKTESSDASSRDEVVSTPIPSTNGAWSPATGDPSVGMESRQSLMAQGLRKKDLFKPKRKTKSVPLNGYEAKDSTTEEAIDDLMSAQLRETLVLAYELSRGTPQDYRELRHLQAQFDGFLGQSETSEFEAETRFAADRRMAQSLAEDIPQQSESLMRMEAARQLTLQEDAKLAREVTERDAEADMEAARRIQDELNAREDQVLAEQLAEVRHMLEQWEHEDEQQLQQSLHISVELDSKDDLLDALDNEEADLMREDELSEDELSDHRAAGMNGGSDLVKPASPWRIQIPWRTLPAKTAGTATRAVVAESRPESRQVECAACNEYGSSSRMAILECGHAYDRACIFEAFKQAFKSKQPFRCCGRRVPINTQFLTRDLLASYREMLVELDSPNPTYCAAPGCPRIGGVSTFIPPASIHADRATCPRCAAATCALCKALEHPGICAADTDAQKLLNLADGKKWKQCPHCGRMVERNEGCLHMSCICQRDFCYNCGKPYRNPSSTPEECDTTCERR